jgi:hypothetical protein
MQKATYFYYFDELYLLIENSYIICKNFTIKQMYYLILLLTNHFYFFLKHDDLTSVRDTGADWEELQTRVD